MHGKKTYSQDDGPLHRLVDAWSADLAKAFWEGVQVAVDGGWQIVRLVAIGLKGDWPALVQLGRLTRHFRREAYPHGQGICHLCMGNSAACPKWHQHNMQTAPWIQTMRDAPHPWTVESSLTRVIPMEASQKPCFMLIDMFHTVHKGVHADLAGSSIAP